MATQECEIELLDKQWLGFYDVIAVALEDGIELPIWAAISDRQNGPSDEDFAKLLLVSSTPITRERAVEIQEQLKARSKNGRYFDIR
ncbi:MAG: hypothetical protein P0Y58_12275 [Candidatus Pseudomonas phytovorans]|uniref:Uncharacterized protein n=1 Tax=Candidatus Pseudomonas phytovorans TaxID=3121377 RepID=A0AAJ5WNL3_9PSED|nr:hypothetical protein [Pseudomonas sp.]WEK32927.1 MAG: hypothetical protein P0Y58_12275 [Pseudomonas sp.]